jgi:hypothetical protein
MRRAGDECRARPEQKRALKVRSITGQPIEPVRSKRMAHVDQFGEPGTNCASGSDAAGLGFIIKSR